jgi:hypothetical protein
MAAVSDASGAGLTRAGLSLPTIRVGHRQYSLDGGDFSIIQRHDRLTAIMV